MKVILDSKKDKEAIKKIIDEFETDDEEE